MNDNTPYEIAVVTKVPEGEDISGNLAMSLDLYWDTGENDPKTYLTKVMPITDGLRQVFNNDQLIAGMLLKMRTPVFSLGEILFLDDNGREVTPAMGGRKPSKWFIETTTVDTLEEAIALSRQVCDSEQAAIASIRDAFAEEA